MNKTVIGMTGGVGSGKSLVLSLLKERYGACILEADRISKRLIEKDGSAYGEIVGLLGRDILDEEDNIRKAVMAERIFRDPEKRKAVNAILHPATFRQVLRLTEEAPEALVVYESAIPVEARFSELCDKILYVYAPRRDRTERLIRTRSYSPERCRNIMRSQPTEKEYRAMADAVLDNSGTPEETARRLKRLLKKWGLAERS